jgi:hypothetical protein
LGRWSCLEIELYRMMGPDLFSYLYLNSGLL